MKTFFISSLTAALVTIFGLAPRAEGTSEPDLFLPEREILERSKALWNSQPGNRNYYFQYEKIGSPDVPNTAYPWTTTVASGQTPSARDANNNPVTKTIPPTIDSLFMIIETELDLGQVSRIDVEYNPQYGYPERIYLVLNPGGIYDVEITNLKFNNNLPRKPLTTTTTETPPTVTMTTTTTTTTATTNPVAPKKSNNDLKKHEYAQAVMLWSAKNIPNYSYRYQESTGTILSRANVKNFPWTITVRNNNNNNDGVEETVTVSDVYGNQILDTTESYTVDDLFAKINDAFYMEDSIPSNQIYKSIDARYHPVMGYPEDINIVVSKSSSSSSPPSYQARIFDFQIIN